MRRFVRVPLFVIASLVGGRTVGACAAIADLGEFTKESCSGGSCDASVDGIGTSSDAARKDGHSDHDATGGSCGQRPTIAVSRPVPDASSPDTGTSDTGSPDTGSDAHALDSDTPETGGHDSAAQDGRAPDAGRLDGGSIDAAHSGGALFDGGPVEICNSGAYILTSSPASKYRWSNGATTQSITVSSAGSYTVLATYEGGCTATSEPEVVGLDHPVTPTITTSSTSACAGQSVMLTSSPASSYLWSDGQTTQAVTLSISGNYTVTTTDSHGCSATSAPTLVSLTMASAPTVMASGPLEVCPSGTVTLTSSAASSYMWSNGATTRSVMVGPGTYTVTATDSMGCPGTSAPTTVTADPDPAPTVTPHGSTLLCPGASVMLSSSMASAYSWSTGATTSSITVSSPGTYAVTTTDANGCQAVSSPVMVTSDSPAAPTITPSGPTSFCTGGSVTLTASSASNYKWSDGETTQSIHVTTSGTYSVTTTDGDGCSATSAPVTTSATSPPTGSQSFAYTGGVQTFNIPACVSNLTIDMAGGAGGASQGVGVGGLGGRMQAIYAVPGGTTQLQVFVGGAGTKVTAATSTGGWNGGGGTEMIQFGCGTGGGGSDIRSSPFGLANRILVAGGGGGAGYNFSTSADNGGAGGGLTGGVGPEGMGDGGGGTQAGGGAQATYTTTWPNAVGPAGSLGQGGTADCTETTGTAAGDGGGGGGGYYGGGGGCWEGGGGGSSYAGGGVSSVTDTQGYEASNGYVTISW